MTIAIGIANDCLNMHWVIMVFWYFWNKFRMYFTKCMYEIKQGDNKIYLFHSSFVDDVIVLIIIMIICL